MKNEFCSIPRAVQRKERERVSILWKTAIIFLHTYEGGRSAISAYWADYTQAQLGAMMATYLTVIDSPSS